MRWPVEGAASRGRFARLAAARGRLESGLGGATCDLDLQQPIHAKGSNRFSQVAPADEQPTPLSVDEPIGIDRTSALFLRSALAIAYADPLAVLNRLFQQT